ncbi:helix-turn-helix transcriptional regulator [Pseudoalteromonas sp. CnMc7-15]|uniref:helix-turn-helix domain-containing protein n=1 Tax=unclassified Pseudoalteromonas TaxID=194690 RepID=UPI001EF61A8A|nr:helix-turn-helix transcriptional regulator [Pseudoalteromonas sp. CnMc7-15]MCG7567097.1 helix-turn-helix transcriptional regulator [Pseudoalteromonas sp. CnMc7-15]
MKKKPYWITQAQRIMKEKGITQEDLLDVFDVSTRGAVGHYFQGRAEISADQLARLSERLGQNIYYDEKYASKTVLTIDEIDSVLDSWLVKLHQLDFITFNIEQSKVKQLLLQAMEEKAESTLGRSSSLHKSSIQSKAV